MESSGRISADHPPFGLSPKSGTTSIERIETFDREVRECESVIVDIPKFRSFMTRGSPAAARPRFQSPHEQRGRITYREIENCRDRINGKVLVVAGGDDLAAEHQLLH